MRNIVLVLAACILFTACATKEPSSQQPVPERHETAAATKVAVQPAPMIQEKRDDPPLTIYPLYDGTPLLEAPQADAGTMELINARDRLVRFKLRENWAWVLDVKTGRIGWTENRLLTTQPPRNSDKPGSGTISETF